MSSSSGISLHVKPPRAEARETPVKAVYGAALWRQAMIDSLRKFDPRVQVCNPVMFVVWLGAAVTAALTIDPGLFGSTDATAAYDGLVMVILVLTVWFANFAEALADAAARRRRRRCGEPRPN